MLSVKATKMSKHRIFKSEIIFLGLILFSNILISGTLYPLIYILAAILHESGHILTVYSLGYNINSIKFMGFGIRIKNKQIYSYHEDLLISVMGPVANGIMALLSFLISFFIDRELLNQFIVANLIYAFINLLPFPPLDGYKIICDYIFNKLSFHSANRFIRVFSGFLSLLLLLMLILLFSSKYLNISLVAINIVLLFSSILESIKK